VSPAKQQEQILETTQSLGHSAIIILYYSNTSATRASSAKGSRRTRGSSTSTDPQRTSTF
jgi:hypothetical protein